MGFGATCTIIPVVTGSPVSVFTAETTISAEPSSLPVRTHVAPDAPESPTALLAPDQVTVLSLMPIGARAAFTSTVSSGYRYMMPETGRLSVLPYSIRIPVTGFFTVTVTVAVLAGLVTELFAVAVMTAVPAAVRPFTLPDVLTLTAALLDDHVKIPMASSGSVTARRDSSSYKPTVIVESFIFSVP
jgi:hypothetical protein